MFFYISVAPLHIYYIGSEALYNIHLCKAFQYFIPFKRRNHLLPDQLPREKKGDIAAISEFLLQRVNLGKNTLF